jgi:hypothetical protein
MRTVLLRRPPAVPVRQDIRRAGQPVFDPLGVRGHRLWVETQQPALHVDPGLAIPFELGADGAVVQVRVHGGHARAGMTQQALDHVLRHPRVDHPGAESVPETVHGNGCGAAGLVVQADAVLPVGEHPVERFIRHRLMRVGS